MLILVLPLCVLSFACLAMSMSRHQPTVFGRELSSAVSRALRCVGWLGLLAALALEVYASGWALGLVCYSGCTSLAAGIVYCALIVRERRTTVR
jgi:hypothetical protein